jgi:hypothetical protein
MLHMHAAGVVEKERPWQQLGIPSLAAVERARRKEERTEVQAKRTESPQPPLVRLLTPHDLDLDLDLCCRF